MCCSQPAAKCLPAQGLGLLLAPERVQRRDPQIGPPDLLALVAAGRPIQPIKRLGRAAMGNQPLGNVTGQVFRPTACLRRGQEGINIAFEVRQFTQPEGNQATSVPTLNVVASSRRWRASSRSLRIRVARSSSMRPRSLGTPR